MRNSRYKAFISYSQKDKFWAEKLHQALESYRVPLGVVADFEPKSRKLGRIFRDDDEMSASEDLGFALEKALNDSECLIVICSPNSAKSEWVDLEVRKFRQSVDARVFAVIIAGAPNSEDPETECFCPSLRFKVTETGELTGIVEEPLAPDWRKEGKLRLTTRLTAGILDVPFDDLWQREVRRRKARRKAFVIAGFFVGTFVLGLSAFVTRAKNLENSRQLTVFSVQTLQDSVAPTLPQDAGSNPERALRLAVMANRHDWLHPFVPENYEVLIQAAFLSRGLGTLTGHSGAVITGAFSEGEDLVLTGGEDNTMKIWSSNDLKVLKTVNVPGDILTIDPNGKHLVFTHSDGSLRASTTVDINKSSVLNGHEGDIFWSTFDQTGRHLVVCDEAGNVLVWDVASGVLKHKISGIDEKFNRAFLNHDASEIITGGSKKSTEVYSQTFKVWSLEGAVTLKAEVPYLGGLLIDAFSNEQVIFTALTHGTDLLSVGNFGGPTVTLRGHQGAISSFMRLGVMNQYYSGSIGSPINASLLATSSMDGTARLWHPMNGGELARLHGHQSGVLSMAVNDTQDQLMTMSEDGSVKLWDISIRGGEEWSSANLSRKEKLDLICDSTTGQLRGKARYITANDILAVPLLEGKEGHDVCGYVK